MCNFIKKNHPIEAKEKEKFLKKSQELEVDFLNEVLSSRMIAWRMLTIVSGISVLALATTIFVIYRYSQPVPEHILAINKDNGAVDVQELSLLQSTKTMDETLDSYWVSEFVNRFMSYDYYTIQKNYDIISTMASPNVANQYQELFHWGKSDSIDKKLGDNEVITTKINSVLLDQKNSIATVRYTTTNRSRSKSISEEPVHYIATISYEYVNRIMTASERANNPLGFSVLSFVNREENNATNH